MSEQTLAGITDQIIANLNKANSLIKRESEINRFIRLINKNILVLSRAIKSRKFYSAQSKLESNLAILKYYREQLKQKKTKV